MSVYYEDNGGDRDSRDLVAMRQSKRRREGTEATDLKTIGFHKDSASNKVGSFEKYTKVCENTPCTCTVRVVWSRNNAFVESCW